MEKAGCVLNGGIRMPIGYRFYPTDEELVAHYLTRKNLDLPLPASVIPEFDVFQAAPWTLPGDLKENRYFFSNRHDSDSNVNRNKRKRVAGSGFWKPTGKERLIVASGTGSNQPLGMKKSLVFHEGKHSHSHGANTRWLMHQYCLLASAPTLDSSQMMGLFGGWFVCQIFQKKRKAKKLPNRNNTQNSPVATPSFIDFTVDDDYSDCGPPQPSSPTPSDVGEDGLDQEESSRYTSFPSYSLR